MLLFILALSLMGLPEVAADWPTWLLPLSLALTTTSWLSTGFEQAIEVSFPFLPILLLPSCIEFCSCAGVYERSY